MWYSGVNDNYREGDFMELGQRLKAARLEMGLSQRQLCGDVITRNMLSQIENGAARPSMDTLRYLAGALGKPLSFFLEENAVTSPNQRVMDQARKEKDSKKVLEILEAYRAPDEVFDREKELITRLATFDLAEEAAEKGKNIYAAGLLEALGTLEDGYCALDLERRRLLLLARVKPQALGDLCEKLPGLDEELMLRAKAALNREDYDRCGVLLDAVETKDESWHFLRGQVCLAKEDYEGALHCFQVVEKSYQDVVYPLLEQCARELEDFRLAYEYACKQKASR